MPIVAAAIVVGANAHAATIDLNAVGFNGFSLPDISTSNATAIYSPAGFTGSGAGTPTEIPANSSNLNRIVVNNQGAGNTTGFIDLSATQLSNLIAGSDTNSAADCAPFGPLCTPGSSTAEDVNGGGALSVFIQDLQIDASFTFDTGITPSIANNLSFGSGGTSIDVGLIIRGCLENDFTGGCGMGIAEVLLTGQIIGVGFDQSDQLQLLWDLSPSLSGLSQGSVASLFQNNPGQDNLRAVSLVDIQQPFDPNVAFGQFGNATVDTQGVFVTPVPAALPLMLTGLGVLGWTRYRRRKAA